MWFHFSAADTRVLVAALLRTFPSSLSVSIGLVGVSGAVHTAGRRQTDRDERLLLLEFSLENCPDL